MTPINNSVVKAFRILNAFSYAGERLTLSAISRKLGMNIATAHRFLATLQSVGAVVKAPDGSFELGLLLADLGGRVSVIDAIAHVAKPHIQSMADEFGETIHAAVLDNGMVCYVAKAEGARSLTMVTHIGKRLPAYCTGLGKALLSTLSADEQERYVSLQALTPRTEKTIIDREAFLKELRLTRERGYAVDNEEAEVGLRCVAVPILGRSRQGVAAISLSAPVSRLDDGEVQRVAAALRSRADVISKAVAGAA